MLLTAAQGAVYQRMTVDCKSRWEGSSRAHMQFIAGSLQDSELHSDKLCLTVPVLLCICDPALRQSCACAGRQPLEWIFS